MTRPNTTSTLRIDFETFAYLATAIAAAACVHEPSHVPPSPTAAVQAAPTGNTASVPVIAIAEPAPLPPDDGPVEEPGSDTEPAPRTGGDCDNDVGKVSCGFVDPRSFGGPTCEGFDGTCQLLAEGYSYRLRVGAAAARCFAQRGRAACDIRVRTKCYRAALQEACPDPAFIEPCEDALQRCQARRMRPDFTLDECVKALSSLRGGDLDWAQSALGPTAEGCRLPFPVL